jgi:hypothetical protein
MRTTSLLLFLGLFLVPPSALASPEAEPDPALRDEARTLFVAAVKAHDQGAWDECRAKLLAALAVFRHWSITGNLAECEVKLGRFRDGAEHAAYTLANAPADRHEKATALLAEASAHVGRVIVEGLDGRELTIDGKSLGASAGESVFWVEPGRHSVGLGSASVDLELVAGATRTVRFAPPKALTWTATGLGVVGLAAIVAGGVFTGSANNQAAAAVSARQQLGNASGACVISTTACANLRSDVHGVDVASRAAVGFFVAGGLVVAGATAVALVGRASRGQVVGVRVGVGVGSLMLSGVFQ